MKLSPRAAILIVFAGFGAAVGTQVGALPFLIKSAGVDAFSFGIAGALGMVANIVAMTLGGHISRYLDHRTMLLIILPQVFASLCFSMVVSTPLAFLLSFIVINFALGMTDLFMNAEGAAIEQEAKRPIFSSYHGTASLGIASFAIISSLASAWKGPWAAAMIALLPFSVALVAVYFGIPHRSVHHEDGSIKRIALPRKILTFIGLAAGLNVACEVAAIQWAGSLLVSVAPDLAAISGLGVAFYGLCGGSIRLVADRLRANYGDLRVMSVLLFLAIAGFVTLSLTPGFVVSLGAFAAVGFGLAITFPCLFSLAAKLVPEAKAASMGYVAAVGGAPRIILPWVLGVLGLQFSLGAVFAACAVVAMSALALIVLTFAQANAASIKT